MWSASQFFLRRAGCLRIRNHSIVSSSYALCSATHSGTESHIGIHGSVVIRLLSTVPEPVKRRRTPSSRRTCYVDGCTTTAHYGWRGGTRESCGKHRKPQMECLSVRICQHPDTCLRVAVFGFPGEYPKYCGKHKEEGSQDVRYRLCQEPGCELRPSFDVLGGKGSYCGKHKKTHMEDVTHKRCSEPGCPRLSPCFDAPGGKGRYCRSHMKPWMIDVTNKKCEELGCSIQASFGLLDGVPRFCKSHKLENMVQLRGKKSATKI